MSNAWAKIVVALITGICGIVIGYLGNNAISNNNNVTQTMNVNLDGKDLAVTSDEIQGIYNQLNQKYSELNQKYDELQQKYENVISSNVDNISNNHNQNNVIENENKPSSIKLQDTKNISGSSFKFLGNIKDNYDNSYINSMRIYTGNQATYHILLNGQYSRFKGTAFVLQGTNYDGTASYSIEIDGNVIDTSEFTKVSKPVPIDINITGGNEFKIIINDFMHGSGYQSDSSRLLFGDCVFYQ